MRRSIYGAYAFANISAAQRTFDGAYMRTALSQLTFSLAIIKIFEPDFFWIGLANCVLALGLVLTSVFRHRMTMKYVERGYLTIQARRNLDVHRVDENGLRGNPSSELYTKFPSFRTAGDIVLFIVVYIIVVESVILYLLYKL